MQLLQCLAWLPPLIFLCFNSSLTEALDANQGHEYRAVVSLVRDAGLPHLYHGTIRSAIDRLRASTLPALTREAHFLDVAQRLQIEVLAVTVRDTELTWRMVSAGDAITSATYQDNSTSVRHHLDKIRSSIRAHMVAVAQAKVRITSLAEEMEGVTGAIYQDALVAKNAQESGHYGQQYSTIRAQERGNKHILRLLRDLPCRIEEPSRDIANTADALLVALDKREATLKLTLPPISSFHEMLEHHVVDAHPVLKPYLRALHGIRMQALRTFVSLDSRIADVTRLWAILEVLLPHPETDRRSAACDCEDTTNMQSSSSPPLLT